MFTASLNRTPAAIITYFISPAFSLWAVMRTPPYRRTGYMMLIMLFCFGYIASKTKYNFDWILYSRLIPCPQSIWTLLDSRNLRKSKSRGPFLENYRSNQFYGLVFGLSLTLAWRQACGDNCTRLTSLWISEVDLVLPWLQIGSESKNFAVRLQFVLLQIHLLLLFEHVKIS